MVRNIQWALALAITAFTSVSSSASYAQNLSAERVHGLGHHWLNVAGFAGQCMDKGIVEPDKDKIRYLKYGAFTGGYLIGAVTLDSAAISPAIQSFAQEGAGGRVHDFDENGKLVAYDVEFTKENCAQLIKTLKAAYDTFSKNVLEE